MRYALLPVAILSVVAMSSTARAIEKPEYAVVAERDDYEVRRYEPYLVAETTVEGDFGDAGNAAFRRLAGYIFGDNKANEKMAMTAPVESRSADQGEKMGMTSPVLSAAEGEGRYVYGFVMERKYTMDNLPRPTDERIAVREVPARHVAALRYSGRWTEKNYREHEQALLAALKRDGVETIGGPGLARHNPPIMPSFMRRNEILIEIAWPE